MRWRRPAHWLRDTWVAVGIALALFLFAESAYRALGAVLRTRRSGQRPGAEEAGRRPPEAWWKGAPKGEALLLAERQFDPYRGWLWARSYHSADLNVDSAGHRVTVQPAPGPRRLRLDMLGASTMWGYTARDSFTIPSLVGRRLRSAGLDVEVTNLAQPAYNTTQEVITLLLELRDGKVPDAVVFLDGHNDAGAAWSEGHAGAMEGERNLAELFGRRGHGFWAAVAQDASRHSTLIQRLRELTRRRPDGRGPSPAPTCKAVAREYRGLVRLVEAMGRAYGFSVTFFYQPLLATTRKARTAAERSIPPAPYDDFLVRCAATTDSLMRDPLGSSYIPLHALFDHDSETVFLDQQGHVTERANAVIAGRMADVLLPRLRHAPVGRP